MKREIIIMYSCNLQYNTELAHFAYGYPDWTHTQHHAGFDIVANRILEVINNYYNDISVNFDSDIEILDENTIETAITANSVRNYDNSIVDGGVCFWITGHSMGAGVANLVAANLIDKGYRDNVYCYTFAAPNTFYWSDNTSENYKEPHGVNYRCIFNIVNEDDFVPEVPMSKCGWTKYGRTAKLSFNSNKSNIDTIIRNENKYSTIHYDWTNIKRFINEQYTGDTKTIEDIVESFNDIFKDNPNNMRYDAYTFNSNDYVILHNSQEVIELPMPKNVKPYQKINTSGEDIKEYQRQRDLSDEIIPNKWYTVGDDKWYYIDGNLLPQRGWHEEIENNKSKWYYLDSETCLMVLGWKVIDKKYYYFAIESIEADYIFDKISGSFLPNGLDKELGQMYSDEYTPDGRYVNYQGIMIN